MLKTIIWKHEQLGTFNLIFLKLVKLMLARTCPSCGNAAEDHHHQKNKSMSLRKILNDALPAILPSNPQEAIKGTELIRLLRMRIDGNYSDASLRYHFSIMSCDPGSPIAKVEKGQGYYRRTAPIPVLSSAQEILSLSQGRLDDLGHDKEVIDIALMRVRKFRAVVHRWAEFNGRQPFIFRDPFKENAPVGNLWKFPEMLMVDWEGAMDLDEIDHILKVKEQLKLPAFQLIAARLRIAAGIHSFREDFFQALSSSEWANAGEIFYASPIEDEALADAYRRLNAKFGIGITSFGLTPSMLDELPRPAEILNAQPRETEALMSRLEINRIARPVARPHIDWSALNALRNDTPEINKLFKWLSEGIESQNPQPYSAE